MDTLKLHQHKHPQKVFEQRYKNLIGLDIQKELFLKNLKFIFDMNSFRTWQEKHHPKGLTLLRAVFQSTPLILLSGDVGCGKTELASCIGTPLSKALGNLTVRVFETPSDTRGSGRVGELSARITSVFRSATTSLKHRERGILIIDEADDLATGRDQQQAHHEDRAGVNALIKELDRLNKDKTSLAVVLITNRSKVMDPAILRRAAIEICFQRPQATQLRKVIQYLLHNVKTSKQEIDSLVQLCEKQQPLFSYSDFFTRIAKQAIIKAHSHDVPYSAKLLEESINVITPSPQISQL